MSDTVRRTTNIGSADLLLFAAGSGSSAGWETAAEYALRTNARGGLEELTEGTNSLGTLALIGASTLLAVGLGGLSGSVATGLVRLGAQPGTSPMFVVEDRRRRSIQPAGRPRGSSAFAQPLSSTPATSQGVPQLLADIRVRLSLSITGLSQALVVSRPTIYAWADGESQPRGGAMARIGALHRVAQLWNSYDVGALGQLLSERLRDGGTLFQLLREPEIHEPIIQRALLELRDIRRRDLARRASRPHRSVADVMEEHGLPASSRDEREIQVRDAEWSGHES